VGASFPKTRRRTDGNSEAFVVLVPAARDYSDREKNVEVMP